jgi:hypothetical protein
MLQEPPCLEIVSFNLPPKPLFHQNNVQRIPLRLLRREACGRRGVFRGRFWNVWLLDDNSYGVDSKKFSLFSNSETV